MPYFLRLKEKIVKILFPTKNSDVEWSELASAKSMNSLF